MRLRALDQLADAPPGNTVQRIGGRDAKGGERQEEEKGEIRIENEPRETMVYAR